MNIRKKRHMQKAIIGVFGFLVVFTGYLFYVQTKQPAPVTPSVGFTEPEIQVAASNYPFKDNRDLYAEDKANTVKYLYVTVMPDDENPQFGSFSEVNAYQFSFSTDVAKTIGKAVVQEGNENGPQVGMYGYGEMTPNSTVEVKGRSTSRSAYKSYKLVLNERDGLWNGQKTINLNKHPFDITRVRNKLGSDYFKLIPNMISYRTQFVNVFVKDLSKGQGAGFEDYGLYTQTEQINKKYLKVHGLDPGGFLYKANLFEFQRYPDQIKTVDDPTFDRTAFDKILEVQGNEDHTELIAMLEDLNNYAIDIDKVIETHFNRENFVTWFATNLVFGHIDANNENYFLYKPVNSPKWSFIPWDYDNAWGVQSQNNQDKSLEYSVWQSGVQNFWTSTLQNRYLRKAANRKELDDKINEIMKITTRKQTEELLSQYYPIVSHSVSRLPDLNNIGVSMGDFTKEYKHLIDMPQENYKVYKESLEKPMPIYLWTQERRGNKEVFGWELSYDFQDDKIYYDFYLGKTPDMANPIVVKRDLFETEIEVDALPKGTYYWKVVIRDAKGNEMLPFDVYRDEFGKAFFGVKEYEVR